MDVIITFIFFFLVFAVLHSLLATDYIKNKAQERLKRIFVFYRIIYNITSLFTFVPVFLIWVTYTASTTHVYGFPDWLYPFILMIRLAAIGLFIYAAYQTDLLDFVGIRQMTGKSKNILIAKGAYGIVRHPLYAGGIIMLFTKKETSQLDLTAMVLISLYLIAGAFIEERRLFAALGEEYRKYQEDVSMFIPVKWIMKKLKVSLASKENRKQDAGCR